jgi:signal transduction histidine kinase
MATSRIRSPHGKSSSTAPATIWTTRCAWKRNSLRSRATHRQRYLAESLAQFWSSAGRMFEVAAQGHAGDDPAARDMIRTSLEAQQGALTSTVAQLLVQNNEAEQEAAVRIQGIYLGVARDVYLFLAAVLLAIFGTTLYLIYSNRRLFQHLATVSEHRSDLARKLITVQEETLHSLSRELHDEFGQVLTAIGAMLRRAEKRLPADSPFCADCARSAKSPRPRSKRPATCRN